MARLDASIPSIGQAPLDALGWYNWDTDKTEGSWLLTYVDVLSIILVIMVVLLGHTAVKRSGFTVVEQVDAPIVLSKTEQPAIVEAPLRIPPPLTLPLPQTRTQELGFLTTELANPGKQHAQLPMPASTHRKHSIVDLIATDALLDPASPLMAGSVAPSPATLDEPLAVAAPSDDITPAEPSAQDRLIAAIESRFDNEVKITKQQRGLSLEIAEVILFDSGKAELKADATPVLQQLALTLQQADDAEISVEGHTDNRPIHGGRFATNWELAAARANRVTHFLLSQGLPSERLRSISYGDANPIADNTTPAGRAANRRVNLRVDFL